MRILVIGATGKVGRLLVARLLERGARVRALGRSAERLGALPQAVEKSVGDLAEAPGACAPAFAGVDALYLLNRPTKAEIAEGLFAVKLARDARIGRIVYQSAHHAERLGFLPHVASKLAIEREIKASALAWTILRPNHFFQNDLTARPGLERGLYIQPIGSIGVTGIDTRDIADAAAIVLSHAGHERRSYNLVGPERQTGEACAGEWSRVLRRSVVYVSDVARWQAGLKPFMPAWLNYDLGLMYEHFGDHGYSGDSGDEECIRELLGRTPRRYAEYVNDQAQEWSLNCR